MSRWSGRSICRDISFTAICMLVSIKIIRAFRCTTRLRYLRGRSLHLFFFFPHFFPQTAAKARLLATPRGHSCSPRQQSGCRNEPSGKRTQYVITGIGRIYSQTAAAEFAFHPFPGWMSDVILFFFFFRIVISNQDSSGATSITWCDTKKDVWKATFIPLFALYIFSFLLCSKSIKYSSICVLLRDSGERRCQGLLAPPRKLRLASYFLLTQVASFWIVVVLKLWSFSDKL